MLPSSQGLSPAAGIDSIGAVELRNALESRISLRLPATLIFDYPTADALGTHLTTQLAAATAGSEAPPALDTVLAARQPTLSGSFVAVQKAAGAVAISGCSWLLPCPDGGEGIPTDGIQGGLVAQSCCSLSAPAKQLMSSCQVVNPASLCLFTTLNMNAPACGSATRIVCEGLQSHRS